MWYLNEAGDEVNLEQARGIVLTSDGTPMLTWPDGTAMPFPLADYEALKNVCLTKERILQDVERLKAAQAAASAQAAGILVPKLVPRGAGNNR